MDMGIHGYQLFSVERKEGAMILKTSFYSDAFRRLQSDYTVILEKEK